LSKLEECALKPKDVFKECGKCPEMIVVPAGSFTMGSPGNEPERSSNEGPQRTISISRPFAVGRFSITFDEWDACVFDGGCNNYRPSDQSWGRGRRPVINVSWDDAKSYLMWLSRKTGKTYRLLSESEREYVARAGATTPFWWGSSISTTQANYDGNSRYGGGPNGEYRQKTLPVDTFQANPWGLYQVHGNVWEWEEDCRNDTYSGGPTDGSAWISGDCTKHVLRGGASGSTAKYLRAAQRGIGAANYRHFGVGFRVARTGSFQYDQLKAAGSFVVQVSAQKSEDDAQSSFRALQAKYASQLGGRQAIIRRRDLGEKGTFFGVLVGPFASRDEATALCESLKNAGGTCIVQKN
jgi:formylglycine-generating enzyme required for sulfatase activity